MVQVRHWGIWLAEKEKISMLSPSSCDSFRASTRFYSEGAHESYENRTGLSCWKSGRRCQWQKTWLPHRTTGRVQLLVYRRIV